MIQPLTPQEKAEVNAWIAEHVDGFVWQVAEDDPRFEVLIRNGWIISARDTGTTTPQHYNGHPYTDEWSAAGPLFDRYKFELARQQDYYTKEIYYIVRLAYITIERGTTGPEAIAKAAKQYEEQRRER